MQFKPVLFKGQVYIYIHYLTVLSVLFLILFWYFQFFFFPILVFSAALIYLLIFSLALSNYMLNLSILLLILVAV